MTPSEVRASEVVDASPSIAFGLAGIAGRPVRGQREPRGGPGPVYPGARRGKVGQEQVCATGAAGAAAGGGARRPEGDAGTADPVHQRPAGVVRLQTRGVLLVARPP